MRVGMEANLPGLFIDMIKLEQEVNPPSIRTLLRKRGGGVEDILREKQEDVASIFQKWARIDASPLIKLNPVEGFLPLPPLKSAFKELKDF